MSPAWQPLVYLALPAAGVMLLLVWLSGARKMRRAWQRPRQTPAHVETFVNSVKFGGPCPECGKPGAGPTRDFTPCDEHRNPTQHAMEREEYRSDFGRDAC